MLYYLPKTESFWPDLQMQQLRQYLVLVFPHYTAEIHATSLNKRDGR
jgi:hypothetical protein